MGIRLLRVLLWFLGLLVVLVTLTGFVIDEPLRKFIESNLNRTLKGYAVEIGGLDFHPLGFSIDFENLVLRQEANPEPPLLVISHWNASIQWTALLGMNIVSDHRISQARIDLHHLQAAQETRDATELGERGWQEALYELYPVTINTFHITDSSFSYQGQTGEDPLTLTHVDLMAENIQNVRSKEGEYPTTVSMHARLAPSGEVSVSGYANVFAEPFPALSVDVELKAIDLPGLIPVSAPFHVHIRSGALTGKGHVEYAPWNTMARVETLQVANPHIDYVYAPDRDSSTAQNRQASSPRSPDNTNDGTGDDREKGAGPFKLYVGSASVHKGEFGFINQTTDPSYQIYVNDVDLQVTGLGTPAVTEKSEISLSGKFMGKGKTTLEGIFRPELEQPDFEVRMKIEETEMTTLNKVLQAHGGLDVKKGQFSFFSELIVHEGKVNGYIKPFFDKPEIYDLSQDQTDNVFQQLYEGLAGAVGSLLENVPRDQIATKTEITGNLKQVEIGTWELIGNLLKNAFVDAMAPTFENLRSTAQP